MRMTKKELEDLCKNSSFNEAAREVTRHFNDLWAEEDLRRVAKEAIDNDDIALAVHLLEAIDRTGAEYYRWDATMGTLEEPAGIYTNGDLLNLYLEQCEKQEEEEEKTFYIGITETLNRIVKVKASSYEEAYEKVEEAHASEKIVLTADDFVDYQLTDETEVIEDNIKDGYDCTDNYQEI